MIRLLASNVWSKTGQHSQWPSVWWQIGVDFHPGTTRSTLGAHLPGGRGGVEVVDDLTDQWADSGGTLAAIGMSALFCSPKPTARSLTELR